MLYFSVICKDLNKQYDVLKEFHKIDKSVVLTGNTGTHERAAHGTENCFEIQAPKFFDELLFDAQFPSPFYEGIDLSHLQDLNIELIPGRIGEQEKHLAKAFGQKEQDASIRKAVKDIDKNDEKTIVLHDQYEPIRANRTTVFPGDDAGIARQLALREMHDADVEIITNLLDQIQDEKGILPSPWSDKFTSNVQNLTGRQKEIAAEFCSNMIDPRELDFDLRTLSDGRSLIVLAPKGMEFLPYAERVLASLFPNENTAAGLGVTSLEEIDMLEKMITRRGLTRRDLKAALDKAEHDLNVEEADLIEEKKNRVAKAGRY